MQVVRAHTPDGEIALRLGDTATELIVNGVFAMDSRETASEIALADAVGRAPGRVLVGGLGLGYTAARLLDNATVAMTIVERAEPLIAWARQGRTDLLGRLAVDPRVDLVHADVIGYVERTTARWDAIVLDVDNGPDFLIHADNAAVYAPAFLATCRGRLTDGGHLLVWCESPSPELAADLAQVFEHVRIIEVPVTRGDRSFRYALYRAGTRP